MKKFLKRVGAFCVGLAVAPLAFAVSVYDPITTAVDWAEVSTGVIAVGALVAAVFVVIRGVRMLLAAVRR